MFFSWVSGGKHNHPSWVRYSLRVSLAFALSPSIASGVECGEFRDEPAHIVDNGNVVVGGRWLQQVDGEWVDRSRDCERKRVSLVVGELEARGDWAVVAGEGSDRVLWVFFDSTCGYCQKLHGELDTYAAEGFEVRYLGYPRAGIESGAARSLAEYGLSIEAVSGHLEAGRRLGLRGTPMLILDNRIVRGYVPAERLAGVTP